MFRPDARLHLRIARTVLVPFGPLIAVIALRSTDALSESAAGSLLLLSMLWFLCSLVLVPALLFRAESSPGPSTDEDGGGSGGPNKPAPVDSGPGGIPLPDAEQSHQRRRDHAYPHLPWLRRRTAREPEQTPVRQR